MYVSPGINLGASAGAMALYATALLYFFGNRQAGHRRLSFNMTSHYGWLLFFALTGLGLHFYSILAKIWYSDFFSLDLFVMISLANAVSLVITLLAALWRPALRLILPIILISALVVIPASQLLKPHPYPKEHLTILASTHILLSITAWAILVLAWLQSLLASAQVYTLKSHTVNKLIEKAPPLQTTERILFELLSIGWLVLSLSIATGFLSFEDLFAQQLVHKTFFTIISWIMLSGVLVHHWATGRRGKSMVRLARWSIALMLIGYLGSKIVIEFILS